MSKLITKYNRLVDNAMAHYPMTDNAPDTVVTNLVGANGAYVGANTDARDVVGIINKALYFDGINDYVNCGDIADMGTDDMTIAFWLYPYDNPAFYACVHKGAINPNEMGYHIGTSDYGKIHVVVGNGVGAINNYANQGTELVEDIFQHVIVKFDRDGNVDTYINNVISAANSRSMSTVTGDIDTADVLRLGIRDNLTLDLNGRLDDVRIYNRLLTQDEMDAIYNSGKGTHDINPASLSKTKITGSGGDLVCTG